MLALRTLVTVVDFVDGVAKTVTGQVVGVTREAKPHYDVMVGRRIILHVPEDRVKEARRNRDIFGVVK